MRPISLGTNGVVESCSSDCHLRVFQLCARLSAPVVIGNKKMK